MQIGIHHLFPHAKVMSPTWLFHELFWILVVPRKIDFQLSLDTKCLFVDEVRLEVEAPDAFTAVDTTSSSSGK